MTARAARAVPSLQGRTALITGASRGIGRAIARRLAAHGAHVVVSASPRSVAGLAETAALIEAAGGSVSVLVCDLADEAARADLLARAASDGVDILVNNAAAISAYAPPSRIDLAARRAMLEINLHAPTDLIQQALPAMRARGWGCILNIGSEMAVQPPVPYPGPAKFIHALAYYGVSKAALDRLSLALAAELAGSGVRVNALRPVKIALSESAEAVARDAARTRPEWIEPLEMMAEAAWLLIDRGCSGRVAASRELLREFAAPLHALDGVTVIGDATSLARV